MKRLEVSKGTGAATVCEFWVRKCREELRGHSMVAINKAVVQSARDERNILRRCAG